MCHWVLEIAGILTRGLLLRIVCELAIKTRRMRRVEHDQLADQRRMVHRKITRDKTADVVTDNNSPRLAEIGNQRRDSIRIRQRGHLMTPSEPVVRKAMQQND